jgi:hypothetical protein
VIALSPDNGSGALLRGPCRKLQSWIKCIIHENAEAQTGSGSARSCQQSLFGMTREEPLQRGYQAASVLAVAEDPKLNDRQ